MSAAAPFILESLPPGVDGVRKTLRYMVALVRKYKTDDTVRRTAQEITRNLESHDNTGELYSLQHFVRDRIRYVRDIHRVETVQTAVQTLKRGSGDCDDKAVLLATLLASIGFATRFWALGFEPGGPYSHAMLEARLGRGWIPLETIVPGAEPGWHPPNPVRLMPAHV